MKPPLVAARLPRGERGIGLMEVVVATVIATVAVLALAYSFGTARGLVNRYELARVALAAAERRMELLVAQGTTTLPVGTSVQQDVTLDGSVVAHEAWTVTAWTDPSSGTPGSADLKRVTVTVVWGGAGPAEQVRLTRLFSPQ